MQFLWAHVHVRRAVHDEDNDAPFHEKDSKRDLSYGHGIPTVRKSKLLIVDLAGSERLDKSGSEGRLLEEAKFINLSLTSLGKCINALAENSPHIPIRDSKLTRLLRDSFGGLARTSLIVTIGPSSRHHAETSSTIMFGQRAMKVVNVLKLKEEFDYESFCWKLENQVEHLTVEIDRQQKLRDNDRVEMEKNLRECQKSFVDAEKSLVTRSEFLAKENGRLEIKMKGILDELKCLKDYNDFMHDEVERLEMSLKHSKQYQLDSSTYQKVLADTTQMYEKKIAELMKQLEEQQAHSESVEEQLDVMKKLLSHHQKSMQIQGQKVIDELRLKLQESHQLHQKTVNELDSLKAEYKVQLTDKATLKEELNAVRQSLPIEEKQRKAFETELLKSKMLVPENHDDFKDKKSYMKENMIKPLGLHKSNQSRETISGQRATIAKI
ncbi:kinesin-like protein KIN-UC [Camellia sinensis]|uniref:kinesin-like protein KIN-UC n=1 Tax=Camellia sinensis TaxID=4442 RepID=UPI00103561F1|nr:kinesin-like protein KIN-UC [Camellia sinensis]